MSKKQPRMLTIQGNEILLKSTRLGDYLDLAGIARCRAGEHPEDLVRHWLNDRATIDYLGVWESLWNPAFDRNAFDLMRAGIESKTLSLSPRQWIQRTGAIGLLIQGGQQAGIYAHPDIAFEFAAWFSIECKLQLTRAFERMRLETGETDAQIWQLNRTFSRIGNRLHAQAIRANLIPSSLSPEQTAQTYRTEADLLNVALFGKTAREWREAHPELPGNMRDHATMEQLLVLVNLQTVDAELIRLHIPQPERLLRLNDLAIRQMSALLHASAKSKTAGDDSNPEPPLPPRIQLRIIEFPVASPESEAIAA